MISRKPRILGGVQARIGSKRLPAKMLEYLGQYKILEWVLLRTSRAVMLDQIVLLTSAAPENRVLGEIAANLSIPTLYGSEDDVLSRFVHAAKQFNADYVVRVCADNPFIAAEEIDRLVRFYLDRLPDYAFNHIPEMGNAYPDGLGAEILSSTVLERIATSSSEPRHREHVTRYLWDHCHEYRIETLKAPEEIAFPDVKLDVDTREDLELLRSIVRGLDIDSSARQVINSFRANRRC